MLSDQQKVAVAGFSQHFMYAVTGMQMRDMDLNVIDPKQFAVTLACGLYAAGKLAEEGLLADLPSAADRANYSEFGRQVAQRYAELVNDTAVAHVEALTEALDLAAITQAAQDHQGSLQSLVAQAQALSPGTP